MNKADESSACKGESENGNTGSRHREDSQDHVTERTRGHGEGCNSEVRGTPWAETFLGGRAGRENSGNTCVVAQKARVTAFEGGVGEAVRK